MNWLVLWQQLTITAANRQIVVSCFWRKTNILTLCSAAAEATRDLPYSSSASVCRSVCLSSQQFFSSLLYLYKWAVKCCNRVKSLKTLFLSLSERSLGPSRLHLSIRFISLRRLLLLLSTPAIVVFSRKRKEKRISDRVLNLIFLIFP